MKYSLPVFFSGIILKIFILVLSTFIFCGCSCQKEEITYPKNQILEMLQKIVPEAKFKLGESLTDIIPCADYGAGCISVHRIEVKKLVMVAAEFTGRDQAYQAAKRLYAYHYNNWVLDDVVGEPYLEALVKQALDAKLVGEPPPEPEKK
ncbi:MAG: hypothetical protein A2381_11765 [Bdellovibrionales bacterium RIFOXYB1_FULL_37_110]|nr:MAG: hypothetical protein A2181_05600 [Bdellovibrionales bacterium RIFOXYA1_FULL_38_20]OFZ49232.1 MAG: hypothetical protein A2417_17005 [Bdellovibrionales bacterium RIFOXYC1_FULL_37_79]OFZ58480.1 MAG: hypothetical protein A2381_11765 [Bdellovibrionales bacterium RIFOXYB1_FULL_37_110]OFZ61493.1 MAG: hypothetical protein A2577_00285 [Bdellovibrionales bacterium RIFOXYD1_FULL_36_51]OFZ66334.1 MAG: hypothetical protein A2328_08510 [Bdellovibrionales bacterium RIFOXYB2_FULL_36_6]OFZ72192.1 MAG: 